MSIQERAKRSDVPKSGASVCLSRENYDWCMQEALREMISFSRFIDEMVTCRRLRIEAERKENGVVIDTRRPSGSAH